MDLIVKDLRLPTHNNTEKHKTFVRTYAMNLRAALGYPYSSSSASSLYPISTTTTTTTTTTSPVGGIFEKNRDMSTDKKGKKENQDSPLSIGMMKRKSPPQRQSEYEPEPKELRETLETFQLLPDEVVVDIMAEALFPHDLLHLNQIAAHGKETRTRLEFERFMVAKVDFYSSMYKDISSVSPQFYRIAHANYVRRLLYAEYMATPPEGLYENPDPTSAISKGDFARKVKLADYPLVSDHRGGLILTARWYRDFLITVAYNEWQRAISLSSTRALQLFVWSTHPESTYGNTTDTFRRYWGMNSEDDYETKIWQWRVAMDGTGGQQMFFAEDFPLTWDLDTFRIFDRAARDLPVNQRKIRFQSLNQPVLRDMFRLRRPRPLSVLPPAFQWPLIARFVVPRSATLAWMFGYGHIELVRLLQFENIYDFERYSPPSFDDGDDVPLGLRQDSSTYIRLSAFRILGEEESINHGALVVDPPYNLSTAAKLPDRVYYAPGGFRPWRTEESNFESGVTLTLENIALDRIVGLQRALNRIGGRYDPLTQKTRSRPSDTIVEISQTGHPKFFWNMNKYFQETWEESASQRPLPLPSEISLMIEPESGTTSIP